MEACEMNIVLDNVSAATAEDEPTLRPIKGGWAASGDGRAVHGSTQEDAIERFYTAIVQHRKIAARPYWYEALQSLMRSNYSGRTRIETARTPL
jgi:hypothetical protein